MTAAALHLVQGAPVLGASSSLYAPAGARHSDMPAQPKESSSMSQHPSASLHPLCAAKAHGIPQRRPAVQS